MISNIVNLVPYHHTILHLISTFLFKSKREFPRPSVVSIIQLDPRSNPTGIDRPEGCLRVFRKNILQPVTLPSTYSRV